MPNSYIQARVLERKKKIAIVTPLASQWKEKPAAEVIAICNAAIEKAGLKEPLADKDIREIRHKFRAAAGLPFDGDTKPPMSTDAKRARFKHAVDTIVLELGEGAPIPGASAVAKRFHLGRNVAHSALRAARAQFRRHQKAQAPEDKDVIRNSPVNGFDALAAALELVQEAADAHSVVRVTMDRNPDTGKWSYSCERKVSEIVAGSL